MTLAVGTALQNGTYVVDAWVSEDAVGPVYLAMHVPKGQWIQLRVLGSRQPEALPPAAERQAFYHYLKQVNDLKHGTFPTPLGGFEEEGICYQTLANSPGLPLDRLSPLAQPRPARLSLGIVKQILDSLEALRPLGWAGLRLTPDQVWFAPETQTITLTGFDLPLIPAAEAEADRDRTPAIEANLVRELSHLLYFLLTGQRAEHTNAPLAVDLRRRRPELPTSLDQALELGSPRRPGASADTEPQSALTLADWGRLLPAIADLPADLPQPSPTVRPAPPPAPSAGPKTLVASPKPDRAIASSAPRSRPLPVLALAFTGLLATASGLGFGLYARLQPRQSTSQQRLNPNQSFPPLPDWNSDALWQPWDEAPALRQRPDYSTTPPQGSEPAVDFTPNPQEPAAPPPAVTQPELVEPEPAAAPAETWEMPEQPEFQPLPDPTIIDPTLPAPVPTPEVAPAPSAPPPLAPPPAPPAPEGAAPPPLNLPPRPAAPAPAAG